jgi:hypothetical protein
MPLIMIQNLRSQGLLHRPQFLDDTLQDISTSHLGMYLQDVNVSAHCLRNLAELFMVHDMR